MMRLQVLLRPRLFSTAITDKSRQCYVDVKNGLATVMMNRPERKNAFGRQMVSELSEAVDYLQQSKDVRVSIFASNVEKCFSAGADLKERAEMSVEEAEAFVDHLRGLFDLISNLKVPTIAAIDGVALGGGLELALACDLRYAGSQAKLGLPETKLAILPAAGGSQRLPRLIGAAKAKELIFTARVLDGPSALHYGIVNGCEANAHETAQKVAAEILKNGPLALQMVKIAINDGQSLDMSKGLRIEKLCYAKLLASQDRLEGLAAFKEGRQPVYQGN